MNAYQHILENSRAVDERFALLSVSGLPNFEMSVRVSPSHRRFQALQKYEYRVGSVSNVLTDDNQLVIADKALQQYVWLNEELKDHSVIWLVPREEETKERSWLDSFIADRHLVDNLPAEIVVIGGGILINAGGYIAEQLGCNLVYVPTTVLSMSDGSIGGKVRANEVVGADYRKHAYKSFYEPNRVLVDARFLDSLPITEIAIGLGEVIKHGVYQSRALLEYLASNNFQPSENKTSLLKAILWTAALKCVCLDIDPDETKEGSHVILRGGHEVSDRMEEESLFQIPHGTAVAVAVYQEAIEKHHDILEILDICYVKNSIPKTATHTW